MDVEYHAAGKETDSGIRVGGGIIQKFGEGSGSSFSSLYLGRGECTEGNKHGVINGTCVVE